MTSHSAAPSSEVVRIELFYKQKHHLIEKTTVKEAKDAAAEHFGLGRKRFTLLNTSLQSLDDETVFDALKGSSVVVVKVENEEIDLEGFETVEDSTPDPSLMRDMGNMQYTAVSALGEAIDNSIQALKTEKDKDVVIKMSDKDIEMFDTGKGMDEGTMTNNWARLGSGDFLSTAKAKEHKSINASDIQSASVVRDYKLEVRTEDGVRTLRPTESENDFAAIFLSFSLGRYGVGVKYALQRLGSAIQCTSKKADQAIAFEVNMDLSVAKSWTHLRRSHAVGESERPKHYTKITVRKLREDVVSLTDDEHIRNLAESLQRIYYFYIKGPRSFLSKLSAAMHSGGSGTLTPPVAKAGKGKAAAQPAAGKGRGKPAPSVDEMKRKHELRASQSRLHKQRQFEQLRLMLNDVALADLKNTIDDQYLDSAASWFPLTFRFDIKGHETPVQVLGALSYHPFVKGDETMPEDVDPDTVLNPVAGVGAKRRRASVAYIWMGRWMLKTSPDILPMMDPKQNTHLDDSGLPPRCFDRVHGVLFFTRDFEVSQNKIAFLTDKALWQRLQQLCQEDTIRRQYAEWVSECHKKFDQEIKFLGDPKYLPAKDRTTYEQIQNVDKPFKANDHVTFKRGNKEKVIATVVYFYHAGKPGVFRDPYMFVKIPTPTGEVDEDGLLLTGKLGESLEVLSDAAWKKHCDALKAQLPSQLKLHRFPARMPAGGSVDNGLVTLSNAANEDVTDAAHAANPGCTLRVEIELVEPAVASAKKPATIRSTSKLSKTGFAVKSGTFHAAGRYRVSFRLEGSGSWRVPETHCEFRVEPGKGSALKFLDSADFLTVKLDADIEEWKLQLVDQYGNPVNITESEKVKIKESKFQMSEYKKSVAGSILTISEAEVVEGEVSPGDEPTASVDVQIGWVTATKKVRVLPGDPAELRWLRGADPLDSVSKEFENLSNFPTQRLEIVDKWGNKVIPEGRVRLLVDGTCVKGSAFQLNVNGEFEVELGTIDSWFFSGEARRRSNDQSVEFFGPYKEVGNERQYEAVKKGDTVYYNGDVVAIGAQAGTSRAWYGRIVSIYKRGNDAMFDNIRYLKEDELDLEGFPAAGERELFEREFVPGQHNWEDSMGSMNEKVVVWSPEHEKKYRPLLPPELKSRVFYCQRVVSFGDRAQQKTVSISSRRRARLADGSAAAADEGDDAASSAMAVGVGAAITTQRHDEALKPSDIRTKIWTPSEHCHDRVHFWLVINEVKKFHHVRPIRVAPSAKPKFVRFVTDAVASSLLAQPVSDMHTCAVTVSPNTTLRGLQLRIVAENGSDCPDSVVQSGTWWCSWVPQMEKKAEKFKGATIDLPELPAGTTRNQKYTVNVTLDKGQLEPATLKVDVAAGRAHKIKITAGQKKTAYCNELLPDIAFQLVDQHDLPSPIPEGQELDLICVVTRVAAVEDDQESVTVSPGKLSPAPGGVRGSYVLSGMRISGDPGDIRVSIQESEDQALRSTMHLLPDSFDLKLSAGPPARHLVKTMPNAACLNREPVPDITVLIRDACGGNGHPCTSDGTTQVRLEPPQGLELRPPEDNRHALNWATVKHGMHVFVGIRAFADASVLGTKCLLKVHARLVSAKKQVTNLEPITVELDVKASRQASRIFIRTPAQLAGAPSLRLAAGQTLDRIGFDVMCEDGSQLEEPDATNFRLDIKGPQPQGPIQGEQSLEDEKAHFHYAFSNTPLMPFICPGDYELLITYQEPATLRERRTVSVVHGLPRKLAVRGPWRPENVVVQGTLVSSLVVELRDEYDNVCRSAPQNLWVTLSLAPAAAGLATPVLRDVVKSPVTLGEATFQPLQLEEGGGKSGTYFLVATVTGADATAAAIEPLRLDFYYDDGSSTREQQQRIAQLQRQVTDCDQQLARVAHQLKAKNDQLNAARAKYQAQQQHVAAKQQILDNLLAHHGTDLNGLRHRADAALAAPEQNALVDRRAEKCLETLMQRNIPIVGMVAYMATAENEKYARLLSSLLQSRMTAIITKTTQDKDRVKDALQGSHFQISVFSEDTIARKRPPPQAPDPQGRVIFNRPDEQAPGFIDYAVNLLVLPPDRVPSRATLWFHICGEAMVFDTLHNARAFQAFKSGSTPTLLVLETMEAIDSRGFESAGRRPEMANVFGLVRRTERRPVLVLRQAEAISDELDSARNLLEQYGIACQEYDVEARILQQERQQHETERESFRRQKEQAESQARSGSSQPPTKRVRT